MLTVAMSLSALSHRLPRTLSSDQRNASIRFDVVGLSLCGALAVQSDLPTMSLWALIRLIAQC